MNAKDVHRILLVEDNPDDVFLMTRLFRKEHLVAELKVVTDGKAAIEYLKQNQKAQLPDLVFLDLKLPFLTGFDVLEWVRKNPDLDRMPVVILSSSLEDGDRLKAENLGAPFLVKPPSAEMVQSTIENLQIRG